MRRLLLALALVLFPATASAGALYTGSLYVPIGSTVTLQGSTVGCALFNGSGVLYEGVCPSGTAAFSGTLPIVITGSGPYAITCPTCFTTAGGSVSGATTFSSLLTASAGINSTSTGVPVTSGASGFASAGYYLGSTAGFTKLSTTGTSVCGGVTGNALTITSNATPIIGIDQAGNLCAIGTIYYTSDPKAKTDIAVAHIDGLAAIRGADFDLSWRYKGSNQVHYGPMATQLPSFISGPNHDHIDTQALATTEAIAIQQLSNQVEAMRWMVAILAGLLVLIGCVAVGRRA